MGGATCPLHPTVGDAVRRVLMPAQYGTLHRMDKESAATDGTDIAINAPVEDQPGDLAGVKSTHNDDHGE